jgi:UDP-GlcNAc:undecaprenyl-phosphate GlcNAc-1-phosphate transferase
MRAFLAAFFVAALCCAALTPLIRRLAYRLGAVSTPGGRHVHAQSTPRLGGVAIFIALCAPMIGLYFVESSVAESLRANATRFLGMLAGATIMCAVGLVDDTRGLRALHKLYLQIAAATIAFSCGLRIDGVTLPFLGDISMGIFAYPVTVLWIVGVINAINLIDGLDGLAGGVAFFAALTNFTVAYISGSHFVALTMAAMLGSLIGFLFWNFNPARIFMGDSGSYFLGFVLATSSLAGSLQKASTTVALLVPILALGVPIFDTMFTMVRRFLERRPLFSPDRGHIHHRLIDMGITHKRAVLLIYGVSIIFTAAAIATSLGRSWQIGVALIAASAALIGLVRFVGYFDYLHQLRRNTLRVRARHAEVLRRVIPHISEIFAGATEEEVLEGVELFRERAELHAVELFTVHGKTEQVLHHWGSDMRTSGSRDHVVVHTTFGVGPCTIRFVWHAEHGDVSPQVDILLQVAVDVLTARLSAVKSPIVAVDKAKSDAPEGAVDHDLRPAAS